MRDAGMKRVRLGWKIPPNFSDFTGDWKVAENEFGILKMKAFWWPLLSLTVEESLDMQFLSLGKILHLLIS